MPVDRPAAIADTTFVPASGTDRLRGRTREVAQLSDMLTEVEAHRDTEVLITGPPGIGRTCLLTAVEEMAEARGFFVLHGDAHEDAGQVPLALLSSLVGESPPANPEMGEPLDGHPVAVWDLMEWARKRLAAGSGGRPTLIGLDDVQWADAASLRVLRMLFRSRAFSPAACIATRRATARDAKQTSSGLDADASRLELGPLDQAAVTELVVDVLGAEAAPDVAELAARAGGNPRVTRLLIDGLREEGDTIVRNGAARSVSRRPLRLLAWVRTVLDDLSAPARQVTEVGAVLGRSFPIEEAAEMLRQQPATLLPALHEAEAAGLIVAGNDHLEFVSDIVWQMVLESIQRPVRLTLHRQAGSMLLARCDGSAVRAAAHLLEGGRPSDSHTVSALTSASRELVLSSPCTAVELALKALEFTAPEDPMRTSRVAAAVSALIAAGELPRAEALARDVLAQSLAAPPAITAELRGAVATVLAERGELREAMERAEQVLAPGSLPGPVYESAAAVCLLGLLWHDGSGAAHCLELVRCEGPTGALPGHSGLPHDDRHDGPHTASAAVAAAIKSLMSWDRGDLTEAVRLIRESARQTPGRAAGSLRFWPRLLLAARRVSLCEFDEAEALLRGVRTEIDQRGLVLQAPIAMTIHARLLMRSGRLTEAGQEARAALALAGELDKRVLVPGTRALLAAIALRAGDTPTAAGHVRAFREELAGGDVSSADPQCDWIAVQVEAAQHGTPRAWELLRNECSGLASQLRLLNDEPSAAPWLVRAALMVGERRWAEDVVAAAEGLAARNPHVPTVNAQARHARGLLDGDRRALEDAARDQPDPWARASAMEDLGVLFARRRADPGRREGIDTLKTAMRRYADLGAHRDAARVRRRLRLRGVRARHWKSAPRPTSGWHSLTDTERRVVHLVASGMTNKQAAAQLFVSPHTIDTHLRHIFRKLGISCRGELRRLHLEELGDGEC
ncbi:helix-turn-helix transcriptional regulator [Streptomyces sp. 7N604]|uniref:helix-turn-helix transcriptional regulator n=1 Tax=Streptomyces sp. 7N604 TaxID=3457415 RepID=UPI003FD35D1D